jgi:transcriptional regulator with XRE-family HTH domain
MFDTILTAQHAKRACGALGLSQGRVASAVDLNRTYLSQLENGRYVLPDSVLQRLRDHYEEQGYAFERLDMPSEADGDGVREGRQSEDRPRARVMDGFVVPERVDDSEADVLLTEYAENTSKIRDLWSSPLKKGYFRGIDEEGCNRRERAVLVPMARNYVVIEQVHSHEIVDGDEKPEIETRRGLQFFGIDDRCRHLAQLTPPSTMPNRPIRSLNAVKRYSVLQ